ncbi:MAG: 50S ribosomal protein L13 [Candidatus Dormibacteraeota bacterium]|nr:50S ribosomal protein L13 [Candidatus Dormibacteraeota bacterium]
MTQTTYQARPGTIEDRWYLVDARGQTLGRLATNIARVLRGKHRPLYTPHVNTGEHVIVINARDVVVTGRKRTTKLYDRYSGYPGGRRTRTFEEAAARDPRFPIVHAVRGMLQHSTLGEEQLKRLRVYAGDHHRHEAQRPQRITFGAVGEIVNAGSD